MRTRLTVAFACLAACLAGCGATSSSLDSLDLDSTAAILHFSGFNDDYTEMTDTLLIVPKEGKEKTLKLGNSTSFGFDWSADSLFYTDGTTDTWLRPGAKPVSIANDVTAGMASEDAQMLGFGGADIIHTADGATRIIDRLATKTLRTLAREDGPENTLVDDIGTFTACGDTIYTLGPDGLDDEGNASEIVLRRVYAGGKMESTSIARNSSLLDTVMDASGACSTDGTKLYLLASYSATGDGPYSTAGTVGAELDFPLEDYLVHLDDLGDLLFVVETWDLESGERTVKPVSQGTEPFIKVGEILFQSAPGGCAMEGEWLYWVDGLGRVVRTNPETGASEAVSDSLQQAESVETLDAIMAHVGGGRADILVYSLLDASHDRLVSIDLASGEKIAEYALPGFGGLIEATDAGEDEDDSAFIETNTFLVGFAVNPAL